MPHISQTVIAVASVVVLVTARAGAQRPDTATLPDVVVTATRLPRPMDAQTATVTVLDGNALRREGVTHLGDALRRVPGLALARTSSFGSQHTLFVRGGQATYVRVLVDGVPLNEPGGVVDLGRVTLDDIERIEVVRGPASVLYGSEAVAGVIQLFTRAGADGSRVRAELGSGTLGTERASLGTSGRAGRVSWSFDGSHHATDGALPFNNGYRNDGVVGTVGVAPDVRTDLRLTARYGTSIYRYPTGSDGTVEDTNAERTEHRLLVGFDAGRQWTDRVATRVQLSAMDLLPRTNDLPDDAADTVGFFGYVARATVTRRIADVRTTIRVDRAQFVTLGAEFSRDAERNISVSMSEFGDFPDAFRARRDNRALYFQVAGEREGWTYTVGGRVDRNDKFGYFQTGRLGAGYRIHPTTRIRASAGTAFKAPTFFENFVTGFTAGNPDLKPERSRSADVGVEVSVGGAETRVTVFTQRFRDLIQYTGAPAFGDPDYHNLAKANAGGVEVEVAIPQIGGFSLRGGHTWTKTRVVDAGIESTPEANFVEGGRLLRRPEHVTSLHLTRALGALGSVSASALRNGVREDRSFATFPATIVILGPVTTVDLSADVRLLPDALPGTRLLVRIENLADIRYQQVAGFDSPGRTYYVGLKLER